MQIKYSYRKPESYLTVLKWHVISQQMAAQHFNMAQYIYAEVIKIEIALSSIRYEEQMPDHSEVLSSSLPCCFVCIMGS
jgi:hypothetical protein